ncbi:P-loop containing nucleoside triphosphate hydrolase protein [Tricharina praecox]|uniref:P-loop containing nucleoside triphosphate hydrolase protein n=1 Tax=Tricharina praecox TaxID=43433 RepID=UPI002221260F|nr:P-loop containing nucleoside triphosphate hydrolase protein [Tricharina praecox]KAI5845367.1 P-loop containing nucleoside triphosphate hydrolase protein [Tricharina praecox]
MTTMPPPTSSPLLTHILAFLRPHLTSLPERTTPLFIALSGPQGSGKTTVVTTLASVLRSAPYSLSVAVLSIDDLYLTNAQQTALAASNPHNPLLQHRGVPGTHDLPLARSVFSALKNGSEVTLPVYDKSAFSGAGDRAEAGENVPGRVDVVLFEGWCVGFRALAPDELEARHTRGTGVVGKHLLENLVAMNTALEGYDEITDQLDVLIHIDAEYIDYVYAWRLQQEHALHTATGRGMTDEQVVAFVDGYMPAYELYVSALRQGAFKERGRHLKVVIGRGREVVEVVEM